MVWQHSASGNFIPASGSAPVCCHDPAHTSTSSLGGAAKGLRVGDFDFAHLLVGQPYPGSRRKYGTASRQTHCCRDLPVYLLNTGFAQSGEVLLELFKLLFCEGAIRLNHAVDRIASSPHLLNIVLPGTSIAC